MSARTAADSYRREGIVLAEERAACVPLPADFDEMLRTAPTLTGSADMAWMGFEGDVNDGEDFTAEEDGEL